MSEHTLLIITLVWCAILTISTAFTLWLSFTTAGRVSLLRHAERALHWKILSMRTKHEGHAERLRRLERTSAPPPTPAPGTAPSWPPPGYPSWVVSSSDRPSL